MKRSQFIKGLVGVIGMASLPVDTFTTYEKIYLKQCFVRGFQYYDGPKIIRELNESGTLQLVREPENRYDPKAIAFYFEGHKIGYLPIESNKTLSILMDTELLEFHAEISHVNPKASNWEKVRVVVYALKEIKEQADLEKIKPYTVLRTPKYYSVKTEDNRIVRLSRQNERIDNEIKNYL